MELSYAKLCLIFSSVVIVTTLVSCNLASHPSDQVLEERLRSHGAEFDKIVSMLHEDSGVIKVDHKHFFLNENSSSTVSQERLNEYRRLFMKLGLEGGIHRDNPQTIRLIASTEGILIPSSEKSYVYSTIDLTPLVNSLDDVAKQQHGDQPPVYKKVFGNWYLYYERW